MNSASAPRSNPEFSPRRASREHRQPSPPATMHPRPTRHLCNSEPTRWTKRAEYSPTRRSFVCPRLCSLPVPRFPAVKASRRRPSYPKVRQLAPIRSAELIFTPLVGGLSWGYGAGIFVGPSNRRPSRARDVRLRLHVRIPIASFVSAIRSSAPYPGRSSALSSSSSPHPACIVY